MAWRGAMTGASSICTSQSTTRQCPGCRSRSGGIEFGAESVEGKSHDERAKNFFHGRRRKDFARYEHIREKGRACDRMQPDHSPTMARPSWSAHETILARVPGDVPGLLPIWRVPHAGISGRDRGRRRAGTEDTAGRDAEMMKKGNCRELQEKEVVCKGFA